jgi:aldose 1-epimerase
MEFHATSKSGMKAKWVSTGAALAELHVPDAHGNLIDVVLGFDDEAGYRSPDNQHFGCTTGRFANRIARGRFTLDGREYQLAVNNGPNHLHGGVERNFCSVDWNGEPFTSPRGPGVRFHYTAPDGEEGYPGKLDVTVAYTLTDGNAIRLDYEATTDAPTIINLTNHSYFNLAGHGTPSVLDHEVWIGAERYTPKDAGGIPTGEIASVAGTPLDFRTRQRLADRIDKLGDAQADGYDHNYILNGPRGVLKFAAQLYHPASGRVMNVHTDQPGLQLYAGNMLRGQRGKDGKTYPRRSAVCFETLYGTSGRQYRQGDGLALETQHFPDSPNQPHFPTTVLRPGEVYRHTCVYDFTTES